MIQKKKTNHKPKKIVLPRKKEKNGSTAKVAAYTINRDFEFFLELQTLLLKSSPSEQAEIIERMNNLGRVKFAVVAGIFMDKPNHDPMAIDLLIVMDDPDRRKLQTFLKSLEANAGKEIRFVLMDKEEFRYRLGMFDRFIRVLLEGPHETLIDKLGI